jgi:hypothetical protein
MIRRVGAGRAALAGVGFLLAALAQALNGGSPFFTAAGGLMLLAAAAGLVFLTTLPPASPRPPAAPGPTTPLDSDLPEPNTPLRNPQSAIRNPLDPLSPAGRQRPGTVQIRLPGTTIPLHRDDPDDLILAFIRALTPADFEHFCKVLLEAMGYQQVQVQGKTGDEGVDLTMQHSGVLVIAQCKRYTANVGAPALRDFYGTLMHTGAAHGFFITTSGFTAAAQEWAAGKPIQLVTGAHLVTAVRRYLL